MELTFDTSGYSFSYFCRHVFSRARATDLYFRNSTTGRREFLTGSRDSGSQLRVYEKPLSRVRFEAILHRRFLKRAGIQTLGHLSGMRDIDLWRLFWIRDLDRRRYLAALEVVSNGWQKQLFVKWPTYRNLQVLQQALRTGWRIDISPLLRVSPLEHRFHMMQQRTLW